MATVKQFKCLMPAAGRFEEVAALPYDVYGRAEAAEEVKGKPYSFLNIDRPETQFAPDHDMYADDVYEKAASMLKEWEAEGVLRMDNEASYFVYELTMDGRVQNGIVGCCSVDDYIDGTIRKHELTLAKKEKDRIRHVDTCSAQTGPIFLAFRRREDVANVIEEVKKDAPLFDFTSSDGIRHRGFKVKGALNDTLSVAFSDTQRLYIADGHHRAASAVKVALARREANPGYTGEEEFNFFLSVLFADSELKILPYNRLIKDLGGMSEEEFKEKLGESFIIEPADAQVSPDTKGSFGMYLGKKWYRLYAKKELLKSDAVGSLDVSYLQEHLLSAILGIDDPKNDPRIDFAGGIRGISYLEKRCDEDCVMAISMYPTSIAELFAVADANALMPPKSTWFEPKLRSGLFMHKF
ncbi:MAG: DUF1015 domain-containing protein [Lachnospiraceae bacterium]|nr:DUF1015 domain-containing protein [Lachnospiraceae bacterium]